MERRDFIKITALTGATAALSACEKPAHSLARFLPEEDLVPGVAQWKPSLCTLCPAGCGVLVRVMPGEAEVMRDGQPGLIQMGLAKKLEGNPNHPINQGKLCARGQSGLQLTYHPDRIRGPQKRSGPRASGEFQPISWQEALNTVVAKLQELRSQEQRDALQFLTGRVRGHRHQLMSTFLGSLGAAPPITIDSLDEPVLRDANALSFGRPLPPSFDLANASYVLSLGADFLGTWNSPVAQAIGYGQMRQGQPGKRAKFVQAEQRMSHTGANADEWIFVTPGAEGTFALSLAHVIRRENLRPLSSANAAHWIPGWEQGLLQYGPATVESQVGISAKRIERIARELAAHPPAVALIGGAALAHTNGLFNALAVNALNSLLGSMDVLGGVYFSPQPSAVEVNSVPLQNTSPEFLNEKLSNTKVLFLYNANPVYLSPPAWNVRKVIERIPFIVSFGSFLDETSQFADLILPDHSPLESWLDDAPECGSPKLIFSVTAPAMAPLHETRAMPDVLLMIAHQFGGEVAHSLPAQNFEEFLRTSITQWKGRTQAEPDPDKFWAKVLERGGFWTEQKTPPASSSVSKTPALEMEPKFDGDPGAFPFYFQPYISQAFLDGSLSHLPWMQELPDTLSTVMWNSWIEINPLTAQRFGINDADLVEVRSQHGKLQAAAVISPGVAPDVIAMPLGQGHERFGRYASNRGANPISVLAPMKVAETGSLAWAATRVSVSKLGKANLAMFSGGLFERPPELEHR